MPIFGDSIRTTPNLELTPSDRISPNVNPSGLGDKSVSEIQNQNLTNKDIRTIDRVQASYGDPNLGFWNGFKYALDQTQIGGMLDAGNDYVRGLLNDIHAMTKDPRYMVYRGMNLINQLADEGIPTQDRLGPNLNPRNPNGNIQNAINQLANLDPTGGLLTHATAELIKNRLQGSSLYPYPYDINRNIISNGDLKSPYENVGSRPCIDLADMYDPAFPVSEPSRDNLESEPINPTIAKSFNKSSAFIDYPSLDVRPISIYELIPSMHGYKTIQGLTLGSQYLWDISMTNYFLPYKNGLLPTYAPCVPHVAINDGSIADVIDNTGENPNFIPSISYSFEDYTPLTENIDLLNGSSTSYITGYRKSNKLSVVFLDDEEFTWSRYFDLYFHRIYDIDHNCTAPYKQSCLLITLYNYTPRGNAYFYHNLIVLPTGWSLTTEGEDGISAYDFTVEFSVVGELHGWLKYPNYR